MVIRKNKYTIKKIPKGEFRTLVNIKYWIGFIDAGETKETGIYTTEKKPLTRQY